MDNMELYRWHLHIRQSYTSQRQIACIAEDSTVVIVLILITISYLCGYINVKSAGPYMQMYRLLNTPKHHIKRSS